MRKILINDGIHPTGERMLREAGFDVSTDKIAQEELSSKLPNFDGICVRSATKVRQDLIDQCPNLSFVARGGVGLDNIDVEYAQSKGVAVYNTPAASSRSVGELVFSHILTISRFLHDANRSMPTHGLTEFKKLKKSYAKATELAGKTIGIIGIGRIGQETAKLALGMGMKVLAVDPNVKDYTLSMHIIDKEISFDLTTVSLDHMLSEADVISLHVPYLGCPMLASAEFDKMKDGVIVVNCARGGVIDEDALLDALNNGKLMGAGLDVFENEPTPREDLLVHPKISLSPHVGGSTLEAQEKIGIELAEKIINHFK